MTSSPKRTLSKEEEPRSEVSPPKKVASPPVVAPAPARVLSPPVKVVPAPASVISSPVKVVSQPAKVVLPPVKVDSPPVKVASRPVKVVSPPAPLLRTNSKLSDIATAVTTKSVRQQPGRDVPFRTEKLSLVAAEAEGSNECADLPPPGMRAEESNCGDESNGVGDKIKIFEKAAEDAATAGRLSRPGSMRRPRTERLPSDELPPPPVEAEVPASLPERHTSLAPREPQRIVRPEFRPLASPAEITIRSPSLGSKAPERFASQGTAFRNVSAAATPPAVPLEPVRVEDAEDSEFKTCKFRGRDRPAVSRGSSYFTRGSEEIWLVKKKDIEEIEERVLDSFRRAGVRGGSSTTAGRGRRSYARSESLEPTRGGEWAGRAHTLKRQASVACTCGHDKKTRARAPVAEAALRPRSRSHGDPSDNNVLDKYETLV